VIKKWLSYREHKLLGHPLTTDEAREVMNIARLIASVLLLEPSLDTNYQAIKNATYPWPWGSELPWLLLEGTLSTLRTHYSKDSPWLPEKTAERVRKGIASTTSFPTDRNELVWPSPSFPLKLRELYAP
jgi:hypothetical protein